MKRGEIKLVEPQDGWIVEFQKTQMEIHRATGIDIGCIEHIGSTSIIGIKAKPMIDFAVGVADINHVPAGIIKSLKEISFHRLRVVLDDEIVIARFDDDETFDIKTHIIHLVNYKGEKWNNLILFRDRLNSTEMLRREYEELKKSIISNGVVDMDDYTHLKEGFIVKVLGMN